jgi:hypothetical protein
LKDARESAIDVTKEEPRTGVAEAGVIGSAIAVEVSRNRRPQQGRTEAQRRRCIDLALEAMGESAIRVAKEDPGTGVAEAGGGVGATGAD